MPDEFYRRVGEALAAPGVGNIGSQDEESKRYYSYYQWVVFILFFQALLCYIPKFLWDMWEGNLLSTIVLGLNYGLLHEDEKEAKKRVLIDYMLRHIKQHNMYAIRYFICEFLALINIIGQLYLMNAFFDGEFFNYGLNVVEYSQMDQEARFDPMVYVFPRVTKCSFHKFGPSGTIQLHDSICILPLNIFNEKSYIFIWFWYIVVAVLLVILILYRVAILAVPGIRGMILHQRNKVVPRDTVEAISKKTSLGDWWVLYMLGRNLDPLVYKEVIGELSKKIETAASNAG